VQEAVRRAARGRDGGHRVEERPPVEEGPRGRRVLAAPELGRERAGARARRRPPGGVVGGDERVAQDPEAERLDATAIVFA
jgi:hypothetical protein